MMDYMSGSPRWTEVPNTGSTSSLVVGDVFVNRGHIFIFMGGTEAAHARLWWALPYAFNIYAPHVRPEHWPPVGSAEWARLGEHDTTIEDRMSSHGQWRDGIWQNSEGPYRIFRSRYVRS